MATLQERALAVLYYVYPATVFVYFLATSIASTCTRHILKKDAVLEKPQRRNTRVALALYVLCLLTYAAQLVIIGIRALLTRTWPNEEHVIVGYLSCILVFGIQINQFVEPEWDVWYPFYGCWILVLLFDITISALQSCSPVFWGPNQDVIAQITFVTLRCVGLASLMFLASLSLRASGIDAAADEEQRSLLPKSSRARQDSADGQSEHTGETGYGSTLQSEGSESGEEPVYGWERREREAMESMENRLGDQGNWFEYIKGFKVLFPYVWPIGNFGLQARAAAVCLCLFASNALHLLIPRQTGIIMDSLSGANDSNPWIAVVLYAVLRLAASESGIDLVRQWLWIPVKYYSHDALSRAAYSHMMHLSADFHDSKHTPDCVLAIYGGSSVSNVVENVLLDAAPMLIDMAVAVVYLSATFGPYEGLITVASGVFFLMVVRRVVAESKTASRDRLNAMYEEHYVRQAGFDGWHTVSSFNQIGYEDNRHADVVTNRWAREQQYILNWYISIGYQNLVLASGLLASAFLAVYRIRNGKATAGQFTMLLMYWGQLTAPLQFFARLGKSLSDDLIDAERLLNIMSKKPTVENKKGARPLKFIAGDVEFENVCFTYDDKKDVIKDISFNVPAGQTVAFVGATGAGKSTILKLLDRFYDVTSGSIRIDGQDVRDVELFSLRDRIGVVPQNPVLFDNTVMHNVRYGRITASDEEVYEACRAACIHDKIKGFTHGYKTRVGERGIKLSGGELQRLAIARAILKNPDIVLLDEATSSVDTATEQQIQESFKTLCRGHTTLIVAHRLSTIMNADRIIVVEHGQIVEQGCHNELIVAGGRYAELWSKQIFAQKKDDDKSPSPEQSQSEIINDLSSEDTETEISKVKPKRSAVDTDMATPSQATDHGQQSSAHSMEGSKLNPIAPTFTPRSLAVAWKSTSAGEASTSGPSTTEDVTKTETPQTSRNWSDEVSAQEEHEKTREKAQSVSVVYADPDSAILDSKKVERQEAFTSAVDRALKSRLGEKEKPQALEDKSKDAWKSSEANDISSSSLLSKVQLKVPRYSRRVQSKSEPSHAAQDSDTEEVTIVVLDKITEETPTPGSRHVSAPYLKAKPPASQIPKLAPYSQACSSGATQTLLKGQDESVTRQSSVNANSQPDKKHVDTECAINLTSPEQHNSSTKVAATNHGHRAPLNENVPPSSNSQAAPLVQARVNRGGKRGRGPRYRGRRGRGANCGATSNNQP